MAIDPVDAFAHNMQSAKVVETIDGEALLIGGKVFHVIGPDGSAADLFSIALRRIGRGYSAQSCGGALSSGIAIGGMASTPSSSSSTGA